MVRRGKSRPTKTGKPVGNDLREQKKSMPIAIALDRGGDIGQAVRLAFTNELSDAEIVELSSQLDAAGVRDDVEALADQHLDEAIGALDRGELTAAPRAELIEVARFVATRSA